MTDRDFERIRSMIKVVFPRVEYLDNQDTNGMFFNILNRYDYQDTWQGVKNCLEVERYAPAISTIVQYIESAERSRKEVIRRASAAEIPSMTVKCTNCNDAGFLWVTYANGTETTRICGCSTARERNPWAFMTDEEYEQTHEQQRKRGQNPPMGGKPGHPSDWWEKECGAVKSISPGQRPPAPKRMR
mgnify:CR=1 FL=1